MTDMLIRQVQDNRFLRMGGQLETTLGATMGATFQQPMAGGLFAQEMELARAGGTAFTEEQRMARRAEEDARWRENDRLQDELLNITDPVREQEIIDRIQELQKEGDLQLEALTRESIDAGRVQTPDALTEQYGDLGLTFDRPMATKEAELLAQGKREELIRNAIIQAGPQGPGPTVARFGAGLAATAVDPLELASMFIPVVGPGKRAWLTAKLGRVGGRATVGAVEGLVGATITEPFYYGLSRSQQLDYTMADALTNIGLGAVLGGGIGAGIGFFSRADVDAPRLDEDLPRPQRLPRNLSGMQIPREGMPIGSLNIYRALTTDRVSADVALRQFVADQSVDIVEVANDYKGLHSAPGRSPDNGSADMMNAIFPDDIYSKEAVQYYGTGEPRMDRATLKVLNDVRGKPDAPVTVYRAVPKDVTKINPGDWVTPNKEYALMHGDGPLDGDFHVIEAEVRAGDLFTDANSIHEFGWSPEVSRPSPYLTEALREAQSAADLAYKANSSEFDPLANIDASARADVPAPGTFVDDTLDDMSKIVADLDKAGELDADMKADLDEIKEIEIKSRSYRAATEAATSCLLGA